MGQIRPWQDKSHAIVRAAFALEFEMPLGPEVFQSISSMHSKFREDYPRKLQPQALVVNFQTLSPQASPTIAEEAGITFDRLLPNGETERAIIIRPEFIAVHRSDYTRWNDIWPSVAGLFDIILPAALRGYPVSAVGFEVADRFEWIGAPHDFRAGHLFRRDVNTLPAHVFDCDDLWHNHHGYFGRMQDTGIRTLNSININVLDNPEIGRFVDIVTSHRLLIGQAQSDYRKQLLAADAIAKSPLAHHVAMLHDANKDVLRGLLTEEMSRRIGLL